ncbi:MAG: J domain-containing protein [Alcanivoracaceae bacterium]|nr:J domain-containing protein [Alcanivoracaceae bacterium]
MDYLHCYRVLELDADSNWETARRHYRTLASRHHPDRPGHDTSGPSQAELNRAYGLLRDYYQQHQRLPLQKTATPSTPFRPGASPVHRTPARAAQPRRWTRNILRLGIAGAAAVAILVFWPDQPGRQPEQARSPAVSLTTTEAEETPVIRLGDRLGHVAQVLGPPRDTRNDRWYYGDSWIEFRDGRVANWYSSVDTPLPVDLISISDGTPKQ